MPADPVTEKHDRQSLPNLIERYIPRDWVFPIVLAVFVGVVVWFSHAIVSFVMPTGTLVRLPSFVGRTLPDAEAELARLGLKSAVTATSASKHYPKGVVVDQQPDAGVEVRTGREITLVISTGMQAELMPDLRFQGLREARLDISDAHLQLARTTFAKSDDVPANHVIAQHPLPLSRVAGGAPVTLTVSSGGAAQLRVPAFVGLNVDEARALAARDHIKLGQIVWTPFGTAGPPHGDVVRQKPAGGARIAPYDDVSLQVSAGPNESGYIIRQVQVLASVPVIENVRPGKALRVVLRVSDATGRYDLYDAFAQPGQKLEFTLTTVGTSVLDMYVNHTLVGETRLGREPAHVYQSAVRAKKAT